MLIKSDADEIQSYLSDASNLAGGHAARVVFPESAREVAEVLGRATRERVAVTISGGGTGIVGGRVPFGGIVLSTERLNGTGEIVHEESGGRAAVEAGVRLADFRCGGGFEGLFYPPDPTGWRRYSGGSVATNGSGAGSVKDGGTRSYVEALRVVLATGDCLSLRRGERQAAADSTLRLPTVRGGEITAHLPSYRMPPTRKHAAGYYVAPGMDAVDLFIGSEGTLGVITEIEARLLPAPEGLLSGIVFFREEQRLLEFVAEARARSLATRTAAHNESIDARRGSIDARALEYFDSESLNFLRERFALVPTGVAGAIFFEQETTAETEDALMQLWLELLERHQALLDDSWFGTNEHDQAEMREFRHQLPLMVNEWLARHGQRKVSTDMAVPDEHFAAMLNFYKETLRASHLQYVIFGHIGDNHVHVNIMPRDPVEHAAAQELYGRFVERAVSLGGTISAEHGVGKIKRRYLRELYGERHVREMAELKRALDPACILGRGNIFAEEFLLTNDRQS